MTTPLLTLTEPAVSKVIELLSAEGAEGMHLRVAVRPGGCSGFSYEMFFDADLNPADTVFVATSPHGEVSVAVDPASAALLAGATLDYKDGFDRSGFSFSNPNASRSCGCGQSFS